jgi:hypothetical protein
MIFYCHSKFCPKNLIFLISDQPNVTLYEDHQYTFLTIFRSVLFMMRNIPDQILASIKTRILYSVNRAVYEKIRKNIVEQERPQITIWCMHIACSIPKATNNTQNM